MGAAMFRKWIHIAGGKWQEIEKLINKNISSKGINVYVYDIE